jgi:hypothetical protein
MEDQERGNYLDFSNLEALDFQGLLDAEGIELYLDSPSELLSGSSAGEDTPNDTSESSEEKEKKRKSTQISEKKRRDRLNERFQEIKNIIPTIKSAICSSMILTFSKKYPRKI